MTFEFTPFEDDGAELSIGNLSVENGVEGLLVHGDIVFGRDSASIGRIRCLIETLTAQERAMSSSAPADEADDAVIVETIANPFI